jgi:transcriptional regulator with XRE-family HTH domain
MARPPSDFLARVLRGARRSAGLSQRALAKRTGVPATSRAGVESGDRDMPVSTYAWLLQVCGWELVITDDRGLRVRDLAEDPRWDAAGRRYPAHVVLRSTAPRGSCWGDRWVSYWGIPPRPPWTYDLRRERRVPAAPAAGLTGRRR